METNGTGRTSSKIKLTAGLFGLFFGMLGVHNFYLGYTGKGTTQLVLFLVGMLLSCIGIGILIVFGVEIWALVESILIFSGSITDSNGDTLV